MSKVYVNEFTGIHLFSFLSEYSGLPIDQVNFILTQVISLAIAPLFRTILHPARVGSYYRHGIGLLLGFSFSYVCFGLQTFHLLLLPTITYLIMKYQNPRQMQRTVLAVSLVYLSCIHLHRQFFFGTYTLDISGPLMVVVQKITSLAFSLHDGMTRDGKKRLTDHQTYYAIDEIPTPYEYFCYIFHHQTLMAGPLIFYKDYINFINGTYLVEYVTSAGKIDQSHEEPNPTKVVILKVVGAIGCALVYLKMSELYPIGYITTEEFILNTTLVYKLWYLNWVSTLTRFKYYYAWMFADAVCNNSGLGFNGYTVHGVAKWDKVSNIDVIHFELARNFREAIQAWNIGTSNWLRMIVYERVKESPTFLTYGLSALWHGFYLGYYITFASAALFTLAARAMRRHVREHFQDTREMRWLYNVLSILTTRIVFAYITFSFVLLDFWPSARLYLHMYFSLHILAVLAIFVIPQVIPRKRHTGKSMTELKNMPAVSNVDQPTTIPKPATNGKLNSEELKIND